jgi:hypothetical protein
MQGAAGRSDGSPPSQDQASYGATAFEDSIADGFHPACVQLQSLHLQ